MARPRDRGRARRLGLPRPHARRPARLAARRRRDVRGADDRPARAAHGGAHRASTRPAASASELDLLRDAGVDLLLVPLDEGAGLRQPRDADRPGPDLLTRSGVPLPVPALPESWLAARGLVARPGRRRDRRRLGGGHPGRRPTWRVGWQGFLRDLVAGRAGRASRPDAVGAVASGRPRRGQPPRRRARDAASRRWPACSIRAPTCW